MNASQCRMDSLEAVVPGGLGVVPQKNPDLCLVRWSMPGGFVLEVRPWSDAPTSPWSIAHAQADARRTESLSMPWIGRVGTYPALRYQAPPTDTRAHPFRPIPWQAAVVGTQGGLKVTCKISAPADTWTEGNQQQKLLDEACPSLLAQTRVGDLGVPIPPLMASPREALPTIAREQIAHLEVGIRDRLGFLAPDENEAALLRLLSLLSRAPSVWLAHDFQRPEAYVTLQLEPTGKVTLYHRAGTLVEVYFDGGSTALRSEELVTAIHDLVATQSGARVGPPIGDLAGPILLAEASDKVRLLGANLQEQDLHVFYRNSQGDERRLSMAGTDTPLRDYYSLPEGEIIQIQPILGHLSLMITIQESDTTAAYRVAQAARARLLWGISSVDAWHSEQVLYAQPDGLWLRDPGGGRSLLFNSFGRGLGPLSGAPDGRRIAYSWGHSDLNSLWIFDLDSRTHRPLHPTNGVSGLTWLDANRLLFRSADGIGCIRVGPGAPLVRLLDLPDSQGQLPFALAENWLVYQTGSEAGGALLAVELNLDTFCGASE
jgi:hypothetical protein